VVTALAALAVTAGLLPFAHDQLGTSVSFVPALIAVVFVIDLMSVYLLLGDFQDRGSVRILLMAGAYAWSLVVMTGYALAFPGAISVHPPLALTPSMAPYFYLAWHGGYPLLLGAAWAPLPRRWTAPTPERRRAGVALAVLGGAFLAGLAVVAGVVAFAHDLPVLIDGLDTSRMTTLTAPVLIPVAVAALAASVWGTWRCTGPERWASVAVLTCLCDLVLTYTGSSRFSVGWYGGRSLTVIAAAVVLVAMQASFRSIKAQAERDALVDPLTGLQNRRGAYAALDAMVALPRRSRSPVGVVTFDLDWFKQVNDRYGHEAGDEVLAAVGRVLLTFSRAVDVVARTGGEEFLVLMPATDDEGAAAAADRLRVLIAGIEVAGVEEPVTASLGVTVLAVGDLDASTVLRRADAALFEAKRAGRNRVHSSLLGSATPGVSHQAARTDRGGLAALAAVGDRTPA
jgi:diguanylate cyclase (GGDEF)-like protein